MTEGLKTEQDQIALYRHNIEKLMAVYLEENVVNRNLYSSSEKLAKVLKTIPDELIPLLRPTLFHTQFATKEEQQNNQAIYPYARELAGQAYEIGEILSRIGSGGYCITVSNTHYVITGESQSYEPKALMLRNALSEPAKYEVIAMVEPISFWAIRARKDNLQRD